MWTLLIRILMVGAIGFGFFPGLLPQGHAQDPIAQLQAYDLTYAELEIKLSDQANRIAGQQILWLTARKPLAQVWLELGAHLRIVRILVDGRPCRFTRHQGYVEVLLPRNALPGESHQLTVLYGGDLLSRQAYPVWEAKGTYVQVALDPSRIHPTDWFPFKTLVEDPLDSMRLQVVFPYWTEVTATGTRVGRQREPGEFLRHTFRSKGPVYPNDVFIFAGNVDRLTEVYQGLAGPCTFTYFIQPGDASKARNHLNQIKRIFRSLEEKLGPDPERTKGYSWFQPLPEQGQQLDPNQPDIRLVQDVSLRWLPRSWFRQDTLANWFRRAFTAYAASLVIADWQGQAAAESWLQDPGPPPHAEAALLHTLRLAVDNDEQWFSGLQACLQPNPSFASFPAFLAAKFGENIADLFTHILEVGQVPTFSYRWVSKGKKQSLQYRWSLAPPGFRLPVSTRLNGIETLLYPTNEWQDYSLKGLNEKDFSLELTQGWFNLSEESPISRGK